MEHMNESCNTSMSRVTHTNELCHTGGPGEMSPLEAAARWAHIDCLQLLLQRGATPPNWMIQGSAPPW